MPDALDAVSSTPHTARRRIRPVVRRETTLVKLRTISGKAILEEKVAELKDTDQAPLEAILARVRDESQLADKATAESAGAWKPPEGYICAKAVADLEGIIISRQTVQGWIQTDKPNYVKDPKTGTGWLDPDWVKGRVAKYKRRSK